jgi:hypothetical protein
MNVMMYGMTPEMAYAVAAGSAMALLQIVLMVLLVRAQRTMTRTGNRLEQLTAAMELLTGTTEAGFVNVAAELERLGARAVPTATGRRATARRITSAFGRGRSLAEIAAAEGLSESEVRLHQGLAEVVAASPLPEEAEVEPDADADGGGDLASATADGRDDVERWTYTRRRRTPPRGAQHAALRV